jgi:PAS domain S-box-containing protein
LGGLGRVQPKDGCPQAREQERADEEGVVHRELLVARRIEARWALEAGIRRHPTRQGVLPHVVAIVCVGAALWLRVWLAPSLFERSTFLPFFMAVLVTAWFGGLLPGLLSTGLSALCAAYWLLPPSGSFAIANADDRLQLALFCATCLAICAICESLRAARRRELQQAVLDRELAQQAEQRALERLRTTLASIGDAVVTTDADGRVTHLTRVAEELTGWSDTDAVGKPLVEVMRIVHEDSRAPVQNPAMRALTEGAIVGLANHSILIAKDGIERSIDDSASPVRSPQGEVVGCILVFKDISERRRLEKEIAERLVAASFLAAIVDSSDDAIVSKSLDGVINSWNAGAERVFGYAAKDAIGRHISMLFPKDRVAEEDMIIGRIRAGERVEHYETIRLRSDGTPFPVSLTISPIRDSDGTIIGASKIARDISEYKRAQDQLRTSEERFRALCNAIPQLAWSARADGFIEWYNQRWYEYTGTTPDQVAGWGWGWQSLHDPDVLPAVLERWNAAIASAEPFEMTFPLRGADGRFRSFLTRVEPLKDNEGNVQQWFGTNTDIDDLMQAEWALRDSEERIRLATEATAVGIWEWHVQSDRIRWDASMFRIYGIPTTPDGFVGYQTWRDAVVPEDVEYQEQLLRQTVKSRGRGNRQFRIFRGGDGSCRYIESVETVHSDANGQAVRVIGTNLDVTDRRTAEEELRTLASHLSDADRRKDEFLATLAHELRNPLAPIRNGLHVLQLAGDSGPAGRQAVAMIERQVSQLVRLVDDLMDVSRVATGKIELRRERVELAAAVQGAVEASRPLIEQMGHELTVVLPDAPLVIEADPTRLAQVLLNLLANAAKYTDSGGRIWLTGRLEADGVLVSVRDNGIGIAADQLPQIFDLFSQVDRSLEKSQGGLGVGLSLVKRLVELHGGSVLASSAGEGMGSEFTLRLPLASGVALPEQVGAVSVHSPALQRRVLVADDNSDAAESLAMVLRIKGHDVRTVNDGEQAVSLAETFRPHVTLLDIGMPRLNGYEACRRIRSQKASATTILVALTGWGQEEDRRRSQEAGFDHHLVKPVDHLVIDKIIAESPDF